MFEPVKYTLGWKRWGGSLSYHEDEFLHPIVAVLGISLQY